MRIQISRDVFEDSIVEAIPRSWPLVFEARPEVFEAKAKSFKVEVKASELWAQGYSTCR